MKVSQKLLAAFLSAAMCVGLAACHTGQDTKWVAKIGEETVPAGVYLYMLHENYYSVTGELTDEEGNQLKNPLKEQIDGVSASQKITEAARKDLNEYLAIDQKAAEMNVDASEEDKTQIDAMVESYWEYIGDTYAQNGVSKDSYRLAMLNNAKRTALFNAIYGEGGADPVPETELRDKYTKDVAKVIMISRDLSTDEDAAAKEEADKTARDAMGQYYKELQDGMDMEDVYYQAQRESAQDPESVTKPEPGQSFTFVIRDSSTLDQKVLDAIFAAENGKPVQVETDTSLYLFVRYDANENPEDFTSRKEALTRMLREDTFDKQVEEWGNAVTAEFNDKALQRYTPESLKMTA